MSLLENLVGLSIVVVPIIFMVLLLYNGLTVQIPIQEKFCEENGFQKTNRSESYCYNVVADKIIIKKYDCITNPEYNCYFVEKQGST